MYVIHQTRDFKEWGLGIKDKKAKAAISNRLDRAAMGLLGEIRSLNEGVFEMKIDVGAGYCICYGAVREKNVFNVLGW